MEFDQGCSGDSAPAAAGSGKRVCPSRAGRGSADGKRWQQFVEYFSPMIIRSCGQA